MDRDYPPRGALDFHTTVYKQKSMIDAKFQRVDSNLMNASDALDAMQMLTLPNAPLAAGCIPDRSSYAIRQE